MLYGGYPSAPLTTRSSARSISSNPSRNGLDNEGTRDIFLQSPLEATLNFRALAAPQGDRLVDCRPVNSQYGHDLGGVQAPVKLACILIKCRFRASPECGQRSIRSRPSALNRCSFSRGATALIRSPIAGAVAPGIRTITSPGGNSPGLAATPCTSGWRVP